MQDSNFSQTGQLQPHGRHTRRDLPTPPSSIRSVAAAAWFMPVG